jgi:hypothetical protein
MFRAEAFIDERTPAGGMQAFDDLAVGAEGVRRSGPRTPRWVFTGDRGRLVHRDRDTGERKSRWAGAGSESELSGTPQWSHQKDG